MTRVLRTLVVDDEPLARRGIRQLLAAHPDVAVVGECRNGHEALRALGDTAPDLVFLDVQMPELDGFGVIRAYRAGRMPAVVFVTAYDEYAVRAFEAHALDYLVKPVTAERLAETLARVRHELEAGDALAQARRLDAVLGNRSGEGRGSPGAAVPGPRRLVVPVTNGERVFDVAEVDWIEADDYYAALHVGGERHLLRESLASLAARLGETQFVRIHRSAIVNLERIREFRTLGADAVVVLRDGRQLPVSRRRRELVAGMLRGLSR